MSKYIHLHLVGNSGQINLQDGEINNKIENLNQLCLIRYAVWSNNKFATHYLVYISSLYPNTAGSIPPLDHCSVLPIGFGVTKKIFASRVNDLHDAFYRIYDPTGTPTLDDVRIELVLEISER